MNYEYFFQCLSQHASGETKDHIDKAKEVWALYYPLTCLILPSVQAYVLAYSDEDVTTYIHIFVYHYGYFLTVFRRPRRSSTPATCCSGPRRTAQRHASPSNTNGETISTRLGATTSPHPPNDCTICESNLIYLIKVERPLKGV